MKVNVTKDGKQTEYNVIDSWDDVTLEKWAELIRGTSSGQTEAQNAVHTIQTLSSIPENIIKELNLTDVAKLVGKLAEIQQDKQSNLKHRIKIDDVEYGFHPNLEEITLGEWADIETYIQDNMTDNLHKIMAVLYRPILETDGNFYTIERYETKSKQMREQKFKQMKASEVESALLFFWTLGSELLNLLPWYLTEKLKNQTSKSLQEETMTRSLVDDGVGSE